MPLTTLLEIPPSRASPDACRPSPHALWLSAGVPHLLAVCRGPQSHGDCGLACVAQFLRLCRASNLAEARRISSPWQGSSPAKTRVASRPSRGSGHHLRPSTNCEKLSGLPVSRNFSDFVARQIERRRSVSPHRCPTDRMQRREPLRYLLVPMNPTYSLLQTARN